MCNRLDNRIYNKKDYLKWAVSGGHPDKGGDTGLFQDVNNCVENNQFCNLRKF